jgi:hypothetical protein
MTDLHAPRKIGKEFRHLGLRQSDRRFHHFEIVARACWVMSGARRSCGKRASAQAPARQSPPPAAAKINNRIGSPGLGKYFVPQRGGAFAHRFAVKTISAESFGAARREGQRLRHPRRKAVQAPF